MERMAMESIETPWNHQRTIREASEKLWNPFHFTKENPNACESHCGLYSLNHARAHIPLGRDGLRKGITLEAYFPQIRKVVKIFLLIATKLR